ncbi:thioredoxin-like domain-containing protein [Acidihalobacter yilgarnensis]|uniref:thioredoxin-like domain-containing protein n=1 Tax=Acidihalobacter yilgarnensis TaxID=2819280 RepID=UPI001A9A31D1|nr:thioredoxin-like domain-containing protein [Acidihalobacter yilgarnensis]
MTLGTAPPRFSHRWQTLLVILASILALTLIARPAMADGPNFPTGAPWFNVSQPLTAADLKGRLVLLDFFTPGCINCIHTLPGTARLEREFGGSLLVIGVNSPKFKASQGVSAIDGFIRRYNLHHPIVTDKDMRLWRQYGVFAWPTFVLLGTNGEVVGKFIGEGRYGQIRKAAIQTLAKARHDGTLNTTSVLPLKPMPMPDTPLLQPGKVAVDARYVAVSDSGHNRVVLFNHQGKTLQVIGSGQLGVADGEAARARFNGPQGLAFDDDALYVADTGNQLIRRIDLKTFAVTTVAGDGRQEYGVVGIHQARAVPLNSPWGLERVGDELYIAMAGDHQIWKLDLRTQRIGPVAGSGAEGIADGPAAQASFAQSSGLAYHDGQLYVADPESSAVRIVDLADMHVRTLIGRGLFDFGLRNGPAASALLQHDQGLAYEDGKLYITDTFNDAIRTLSLATQTVSTLTIGLAQPGGLAILAPTVCLWPIPTPISWSRSILKMAK